MIAPTDALVHIPDDISATEAAPMMCAGITTFNALRNSGARPGDVVVILGIGGLGHLGNQFSNKMGYKTIAIGRGKDKEQMAKKLGDIHYIDSNIENVAVELFKHGGGGGGGGNDDSNAKGAKAILATMPSSKAMSSALEGLAVNGKLFVIGASNEPIEIPPLLLLSGRRSVVGWPSGSSIDSQDTLSFAIHSGVRSVNGVFPLERVSEAYGLMMSGKVKFRVVLQP